MKKHFYVIKKGLCVTLTIALLLFMFCSCSSTNTPEISKVSINENTSDIASEPAKKLIKIPDIEKLDITTAKTLLAGKGLIPKIEYEYNNDYDYDLVIRSEPAIGSEVEEDTPITLYVCKGPSYYVLPDTVGYMMSVNNIDDFSWGDDGKPRTKGFYSLYVEEGYLFIPMYLKCTSKYTIEFYGDFGTASINDSFDKTVPIKVIYDSEKVDNNGGMTEFKVKIPLSDLGVQKPTNVYIEFDFLVNGQREDFSAGFDMTW